MESKKIIQGINYRFTIITNQLIRMEYSETGEFVDELTKFAQNRDFDIPKFRVVEKGNMLEIITEYIHLYYVKEKKFTNSTLYADLKYNYSAYGNRWHFGDVPKENLKGTVRTLDHANGEVPLEDGIISKTGFSIVDDSDTFFVSGNVISEKKFFSNDLYLFAYGREYKKAIQDFYRLSGPVPLLPKYALGNWWSRFWKYNEKEYLNLMRKFREKKIPLSVSVLDMDWHVTEVDSKYGSGWTGYTWNKDLFPNPSKFMEDLHELGLTTSLNVHPADGIRAFEESYYKVAERLGLDTENEEPALFNLSDDEFKRSYFEDVHHPLEQIGTDFWWLDWQQGTSGYGEVDPLWLLNINHYEDIQRKDKNDIILSRYAGLGSHRYPIGFSGDTHITWDSLAFQPYLTATASNVGYSWWSHDIGGHMKGYRDEELSLRWLQFGVFSPINRLHSSNNDFTGKEPWNYSLEIEKNMISYLQLRHQLLPYIYTMNVRNNQSYEPFIMPIYYEYPNEENAYLARNQYFFGSELMVVPVVSQTNSIIKKSIESVYLPEGIWFDFFTHQKYKGGCIIEVARGLENIPVFAKEGAIIPMDYSTTSFGNLSELPNFIHWKIFPGKNNFFELVEDYDGKRVITKLSLDIENDEILLTHRGDISIIPESRKHVFHFVGADPFIPKNKMNDEVRNYSYNQEKLECQMEVEIPNKSITTVIDISGFETIKHQNVEQTLFDLLNQSELLYENKQKLWNELKKSTDLLVDISVVESVEEVALKKALLEILHVKYS